MLRVENTSCRSGPLPYFRRVCSAYFVIACWLGNPANSIAAESDPVSGSPTVLFNLTYREGFRSCTLDLALPIEHGGKPLPVIVVIHGGGWLEGDKSSFVVATDRTPCDIQNFAALGFASAAINYRLSDEAPFPAAFHDCQCAIRWLRAHAAQYHLDPNRIGVYGNSAGGHLALMLAMIDPAAGLDESDGPWASLSSRVQSAASDSGPIDLVAQFHEGAIKEAVRRFLGGPPEGSRLTEYRRASPINQLPAEIPPLLLIYGEADEQVPVKTADRFVEALGRAGRTDISYFRLAAVGHCPHSIARVAYLPPVVNEFFLRTLSVADHE